PTVAPDGPVRRLRSAPGRRRRRPRCDPADATPAHSAGSAAGVEDPRPASDHRVDQARLTLQVRAFAGHRPESFDVPLGMAWFGVGEPPGSLCHAAIVPQASDAPCTDCGTKPCPACGEAPSDGRSGPVLLERRLSIGSATGQTPVFGDGVVPGVVRALRGPVGYSRRGTPGACTVNYPVRGAGGTGNAVSPRGLNVKKPRGVRRFSPSSPRLPISIPCRCLCEVDSSVGRLRA